MASSTGKKKTKNVVIETTVTDEPVVEETVRDEPKVAPTSVAKKETAKKEAVEDETRAIKGYRVFSNGRYITVTSRQGRNIDGAEPIYE